MIPGVGEVTITRRGPVVSLEFESEAIAEQYEAVTGRMLAALPLLMAPPGWDEG